tara:strand:- start:11057 stop:11860 length:804 start_codon:yes stop_codon:yes gene_type:complete
MSVIYKKKIFIILSLFFWILMISVGFYLDKKVPDYDEVFIKKIMLSSFDMESKHLYLNYNNKKLTTNEEIRSLEDKYNSIFVKNDFKNLIINSEFVVKMYKIISKNNTTKMELSLNNEKFVCAISQDFNHKSGEIDKELKVLIFTRDRKNLDYCHRYFFDQIMQYLNENLKRYLLITKDIRKFFTKSELKKYKIITLNENIREEYTVKMNKIINEYQDSFEKDYIIINRFESRMFLLNYKFTIFFIFFPVYLLLIYTFIPNLRKEAI